MTQPRIVAIESVVPEQSIDQRDLMDLFTTSFADVANAADLLVRSRVRTRHLVWGPQALADGSPLLGARMRAWEQHVVELGGRLLPAVLAGVPRERVGTFVMVSSTGYTNPGPEVVLARDFGLRADLRRTFIGHMGCYAAFPGIKVALDAVRARPDELALVCCIELSSLHMTEDMGAEQAVVHALFGDAGAAVLISAGPDGTGPEILGTHTETIYDALDAMTLKVYDDAFKMTLSPHVPMLLAREIERFVDRLLAPAGLTRADIAHWAIHSGGPKIIDVVGRRLRLTDDQLRASREILAEYGNCASATILLIMERLFAGPDIRPGDYGVCLAFGPGVTLEGMLVRC